MFHVYAHTLTASDTANDPYIRKMKLEKGVIHQIDILFQDGCKFQNHVQIYQGASQIWPSNRSGSFIGNQSITSFREFFPLRKGANELSAKIWTDDTSVLGTIVIQIGILPRGILQPLSFSEIIKAIKGE